MGIVGLIASIGSVMRTRSRSGRASNNGTKDALVRTLDWNREPIRIKPVRRQRGRPLSLVPQKRHASATRERHSEAPKWQVNHGEGV